MGRSMPNEQEELKERDEFQEGINKPPGEGEMLIPANVTETDVSSRSILIKKMPGAEKFYYKFRGDIL